MYSWCPHHITSLIVAEVLVLCEEHWQKIGASGGCDVFLEIWPQGRMDRYRSPRQHYWVEVGVVLYLDQLLGFCIILAISQSR
jgi:hypothetical protein